MSYFLYYHCRGKDAVSFWDCTVTHLMLFDNHTHDIERQPRCRLNNIEYHRI